MIVKSVDSEIFRRNCQFKLFHVIATWLWIDVIFAALTCLNKFCAKMRKFFCLFASSSVYRTDWMLVKTADVRCLKRLINALYHICRNAFLNIFFFKFDNFVECHIKAKFRKHCKITFRILFDFRCTVIFFNRSTKAYTSR